MPGSLHEDLSTFYWYRRHKFAIKELLCKTQYCCGFDSDVHCLNNASFLTKRYNLYKVLACSGHILPPISILCYFLPISYIYALYIFQNFIFPTWFRSSNWSFRHGFPSLNLLHNIIPSHAFNMA